MPEDQPEQQAPKSPPDPFTQIQTGWINVVEMYAQARRANAGWVGGAFLTAAFVIMNGAAQADYTPGEQS